MNCDKTTESLQSLKSRGFVKEQFAWHHYYWWLTNEGIEFLRTELNLPAEIVPGTLKRQQRPPDARFQGPSPAGPGRGGPPGERAPRFGQGGDREGYRRRPESDKVAEAGPGAPSGGRPFVPVCCALLCSSANKFTFVVPCLHNQSFLCALFNESNINLIAAWLRSRTRWPTSGFSSDAAGTSSVIQHCGPLTHLITPLHCSLYPKANEFTICVIKWMMIFALRKMFTILYPYAYNVQVMFNS